MEQGEKKWILVTGFKGARKHMLVKILTQRLCDKKKPKKAQEPIMCQYENMTVVETPDLDGIQVMGAGVVTQAISNWRELVRGHPTAILMVVSGNPSSQKDISEPYRVFKSIWGMELLEKMKLVYTFYSKSKPKSSTPVTHPFIEVDAGLGVVSIKQEDSDQEVRAKLGVPIRSAPKRCSGRGDTLRVAPTNTGDTALATPHDMSISKKKPDNQLRVHSLASQIPTTPSVLHDAVLSRSQEDARGHGDTRIPPTKNDVRVLIIGKTGTGKSTLGNVLLGDVSFKTGKGMFSTTTSAQRASNSKNIVVVDTPDIDNLRLTRDRNIRNPGEEIRHWKTLLDSEPDVILITIACDVRYTKEEHAIYLQIKELWGRDPFCEKLIVAFTFGDRQDRPIEEELETVSEEEKAVLRDAGGRYVLFDNSGNDKTNRFPYSLKILQQLLENMKGRSVHGGIQINVATSLNKNVNAAGQLTSSDSSQGPNAADQCPHCHPSVGPKATGQSDRFDCSRGPNATGQSDRSDYSRRPNAKGQSDRSDYSRGPNATGQSDRSDYSRGPNATGQSDRSDYSRGPNATGQSDRSDYSRGPNATGQSDRSDYSRGPNATGQSDRSDYSRGPNATGQSDRSDYSRGPNATGQSDWSDYSRGPNATGQSDQSDYSRGPNAAGQENPGDFSKGLNATNLHQETNILGQPIPPSYSQGQNAADPYVFGSMGRSST